MKPPTVLGKSVAGGDAVCVGDHHRVLAQVVLVWVGKCQPGAEEPTEEPLESDRTCQQLEPSTLPM